MAAINTTRVNTTRLNPTRIVLGGLVSGLVMNVGEAALHGGVLGADAQALFTRHQLDTTASPVPIVSLILMTFVLGIASVWLYAAIRPRYGAGARTAIVAGLAVWLIAHMWAAVYLGMGFANLIPAKLLCAGGVGTGRSAAGDARGCVDVQRIDKMLH